MRRSGPPRPGPPHTGRMGRGRVLVSGAAVIGLVLAGCAGSGAKPGPWTSRATFTIRSVSAGARSSLIGTYTAADSTVPYGPDGNAELYQGLDPRPNAVMDLSITIGDNPDTGTNVSQFDLFIPAVRGTGTYRVTFADRDEDVDVSVNDWASGVADEWSMNSRSAACTVKVTSDVAMRNRTIREIKGSFGCRGLYDSSRLTNTAELTGRFDVFAQIWCDTSPPVRPCHVQRGIPNYDNQP